MIYTVKKRNGAWTVDTGGVMLTFESYIAAVNTAQEAAQILKRSHSRLDHTGRPYGLCRSETDISGNPTLALHPAVGDEQTRASLSYPSPI